MCKLNPDDYTCTCWRRSGETELANDGAGLINLKRAGRWKRSTVVEGYIAKSNTMKEIQANLLTGGPAKKWKIEEKAEEVVSDKPLVADVMKMPDAMKMPVHLVMGGKPEWAVSGTVVINNYYQQYK
eukprot:4031732-Ditylum_brightwellii.AAC.1